MKKYLNKFAIWLYKKTRTVENSNAMQTFMGLPVYKNSYMPKGKIFMGTAEGNMMEIAFLDKEITLKKPNEK